MEGDPGDGGMKQYYTGIRVTEIERAVGVVVRDRLWRLGHELGASMSIREGEV